MTTTTYLILWLWAFWLLYVLVMGLYRAHLSRRLGPVTKILALPVVLLGLGVDAVTNVTLASVVFLEPPREALVTTRLIRHVRDGSGWRFSLAKWVCSSLLDPFDPSGSHCRGD